MTVKGSLKNPLSLRMNQLAGSIIQREPVDTVYGMSAFYNQGENVMNRFNNDQPAWHDYLGDMLRGDVPVNQLVPQHPYLLDTLKLEEVLHKNTEHILLLNTDEAYAVLNALYNKGTTYSGNIKDATSGMKNISKLVSYKDAGKLVINLKGLGIKAVPYVHKGVTYIKITGYPSVRRILNGTRYAVNNPKYWI
jgi:hypothetical protein